MLGFAATIKPRQGQAAFLFRVVAGFRFRLSFQWHAACDFELFSGTSPRNQKIQAPEYDFLSRKTRMYQDPSPSLILTADTLDPERLSLTLGSHFHRYHPRCPTNYGWIGLHGVLVKRA